MAVLMLLIRLLGLNSGEDKAALHFARCQYQPSPEPGFVKWTCG